MLFIDIAMDASVKAAVHEKVYCERALEVQNGFITAQNHCIIAHIGYHLPNKIRCAVSALYGNEFHLNCFFGRILAFLIKDRMDELCSRSGIN